MAEINLLQPGENIRPILTLQEASQLLHKLYGLRCTSIKELNGYDDKNYKVLCFEDFENKNIVNINKNGYVLKVLNSLDSNKINFVDAQNKLMLYVEKNGIQCPVPIPNKTGNFYSVETLKSGKHIVRLLLYQPGSILYDISVPDYLYKELGELVAKFDVIVQNFHHSAYDNHKTLWMLEAVPKLRQFMYAVVDLSRKKLVETIILQFEDRVLQNIKSFEKGMIHGDFNEQNIVVSKNEIDEWHISSILDFGDTQFSCLIFELAVAITYMIIIGKNINVGGLVIAGYSRIREIPDVEFSVLKISIAARLCQSLVLGAYSSLQDPDNKYVATTQAMGWKILEELWAIPDKDLLEKWKNCIES